MEQGREEDAQRVSADQRRSMRGSADAEMVSCLMEYQRASRQSDAESRERANIALDAALAAHAAITQPLTAALEFDLFNACCQDSRYENALAIGESILAHDGVEPRIAERVQNQVTTLRQRQQRAAAIVPLDQVIAMAGRLLAKGWDEAIGQACKASLAYWGAEVPDAELLPVARERLAEALRNYGMDESAGTAQPAAPIV